MKIVIFLNLFLVCFSPTFSIYLTPKAKGLSNHHGTNPQKNLYGPEREIKVPRVGGNSKEDLMGLEVINSENWIAGKIGNVSHDAKKIISPQIAQPKVEINMNIPIFQDKTQVISVVGVNKQATLLNNNVIKKTDQPIIGVTDKVRN